METLKKGGEMDNSILSSVKKYIGITDEYTEFDSEIIEDINSVFFTLSQLGVGPKEGFSISGQEDEWTSYTQDSILLQAVKPYVKIKVKLIFDSPSNSFTLTSLENQAKEYEWRLNSQVETES